MTVKSCEKLEKSQVALTIEVGAAEFEAAVEKAYQKMRRKMCIRDRLYLASGGLDAPVRFDVAEVYDEGGSLRIEYIENAFI